MVKASIALVTGSSSGIGFETSLALARKGIDTREPSNNCPKDGCK
jgi:NAD(P)-dependent dehydrogenase (short-subunit alcohol dehydrogenase family)